MVRFKVIKGSHLLFGAAIALLTLVVVVLVIDLVFSGREAAVHEQASLVRVIDFQESEAETNPVFASLNAHSDALELDPESDSQVEIDIMAQNDDEMREDKPSVLIYHTHTHEAYEQTAGDCYVAIEAWRTNDPDHSVVRVGEELAVLLREYGFNVVHDTTDHELNELGTAYTRSLETLQGYTERFDLYIDLHRDAYIDGVQYANLSDSCGSVAQMMLLIGNGVGFEDKPFYAENLTFAQRLTERINDLLPGICREVMVKDGRYNQNIGVYSILLEVGHNRNTLHEALNALPYFAQALNSLLIEEPDAELVQRQAEYFEGLDGNY